MERYVSIQCHTFLDLGGQWALTIRYRGIEPTETEDSFEPFQEWVNLNSFVARLFAHELIDWYRYGFWTMMGSLDADDANAKDLRESRVAAATQWIAHGALALFHVIREKEVTEVDQRYQRSAVFNGDKVIPFER